VVTIPGELRERVVALAERLGVSRASLVSDALHRFLPRRVAKKQQPRKWPRRLNVSLNGCGERLAVQIEKDLMVRLMQWNEARPTQTACGESEKRTPRYVPTTLALEKFLALQRHRDLMETSS
jgi:hypothetical protein